MAKKICIANRKGGVGKSTTALALACGLAKKGKKVLMVDTDPQRNTTSVYGAKIEDTATLYDIFFSGISAKDCIQKTNLGDIIPSDDLLKNADTQIDPNSFGRFKIIKKALAEVENDYDYIIFDTPPLLGILLNNVLMASDYIIIPCTCDKFGLQGMVDFYDTVKNAQEENEKLKILGLLIIKYKGRQTLTKDLEDNLLPDYAKTMNTKVFKTRIRESVKCQESQILNKSIFEYAPTCNTAIDYMDLIKEIEKEIKK